MEATLRGWGKDDRASVFQAFNLTTWRRADLHAMRACEGRDSRARGVACRNVIGAGSVPPLSPIERQRSTRSCVMLLGASGVI